MDAFDSAARIAIIYTKTMETCCVNLSFANVQGDLQLEIQILRDDVSL